MSRVRVLVGTRKGAFVLESDGQRERWNISGPHFAGWEIYHLKGSLADPDRVYASQSSAWFGQLIQRSNDGGKTWEPVGNQFVYDGVPGRTNGTTARRIPGSSKRVWHSNRRAPIRTRSTPGLKTPPCFAPPTAAQSLARLPGAAAAGPRMGPPCAGQVPCGWVPGTTYVSY